MYVKPIFSKAYYLFLSLSKKIYKYHFYETNGMIMYLHDAVFFL